MVAALWAETKDEQVGDVAIKVKHIGTTEDPMLFEKMERRWISFNAKLARRVRAELAKEYGSLEDARAALYENEPDRTVADAVSYHAYMSEEYITAFSERVRDLVVHGCVDGSSVYVELMNRGGPDHIKKAAALVMEYNAPSPKT